MSKLDKAMKVDLTVIKRLLSELESELNAADAMKTDVVSDKAEWIVTLNKATGLAAGIMTEGGMLMGDIQQMIAGDPQSLDKQDFLKTLLGSIKGPGSTN